MVRVQACAYKVLQKKLLMPFCAIIMSMKNKVNILIFILWCVFALIGLFHHEIWRDEAQVWCLVRDMNFTDLFAATRIEGHPILWYFLLLPLAKFGLPVESMQFVSFALIGSAVAFMLLKSPFSNLEKVLVALSAGILYFLPVIARNYALIPLAIFLVAYLYQKRSEKPYKYALSLILLSQTHSLMFAFAGMLFVFFSVEKIKEEKHIMPIILLAINFLYLFFNFCFAGAENMAVQNYSERDFGFAKLLYEFCYLYFRPLFISLMPLNLFIFYGSLVVVAYSLFKQDKKIFALFLVSFAYIFFIFAKVWFGGVAYQKAFSLLLIILFCYWVTNKEFKPLKIVFSIIFTISSLLSIPAIIDEVKYQFSGSKQITTYIKENLQDKDYQFLGYLFTISPISAYLPDRQFYSARYGQPVTYMDFRRDNYKEKVSLPPIKYIVVQEDAFGFDSTGFKEIFSTDNFIIGSRKEAEVYKIYEKI